jgi:thiopeptide-type bacteriocin biosynthesis protein
MSVLSSNVMLRCPTLPVDRYPYAPSSRPSLDDIAHLWRDPVLRESIRVASSVLYDAVTTMLAADLETVQHKKVVSTYQALVRYAVRISTRPTPFGTFGGFAMVGVADGGRLRLGDVAAHRKHVRPGSDYARHLTAEADTTRDDLLVQVNPSGRLQSGRVAVMVRPRGSDGMVNEASSVRATRPVRAVLQLAGDPIRRGELLSALSNEFPEAGTAVLHGFVDELCEAGLLVTELDGSVFDPDPLARLRSDPRVGPRTTAVTAAIARYSRLGVGTGERELGELYRLLRADRNTVQEQLQVDLELAVDGTVPPSVLDDARSALRALLHLTPVPPRRPELRAHAERFGERFGETLVPLPEVVDPDRGIGFPAGYSTSRHRSAASGTGVPEAVERAGRRLRARLLDRAYREQRTSVTLTDDDLVTVPPAPGLRATSYDVFLQMQQPHPDDRVRSSLGPIGVAMPAGKAHGRFAHHSRPCREQLTRAGAQEREWAGDDLFFEIDYVCNRPGVNNVAFAPGIHPLRMRLTTGDFDDEAASLPVRDVLVGVGPSGFHLVHGPTGRPLVCRSGNLVAPDVSADVVRFLQEIGVDGLVRPAWLWDGLEDVVDFLPGVVHRQVQLSPARWRLPELAGSPDEQDRVVLSWAQTRDVPDHVHIGVLDNRLLLDLRNRVHRDLLRREARTGVEWAMEAPDPVRLGWVRDDFGRMYAAELVVSVTTDEPDHRPPIPPSPRFEEGIGRDRELLPGREWWYARVYCPVSEQNACLSRLSDLLPDGSWFHVRYRDIEDHLRVRVRAPEHGRDDPTGVLNTLVDEGYANRYVVATYRREIERYGGLAAMRAAEELFCAESAFLARRTELVPPPGIGHSGSAPDVTDPRWADAVELLRVQLDAICDVRDESAEVLQLACAGYREEFPAEGPALRRAVGRLGPVEVSQVGTAASEELAGLLAAPGRQVAAALRTLADPGRRTRIRQALVHMFANRIGLERRQEYQAVFLIDRLARAERHRKAIAHG